MLAGVAELLCPNFLGAQKSTSSGYPKLCDRIFLFSFTLGKFGHKSSGHPVSFIQFSFGHILCKFGHTTSPLWLFTPCFLLGVSGFKPYGDLGRRNPRCHVGAWSCPGVLRGHLTRAVLQAHSAASGLRQIPFLDIQSVFPQTPPRSSIFAVAPKTFSHVKIRA